MKTSTVTASTQNVRLDNVLHPYKLTDEEENLCESTGSVNFLDVSPVDDKACKALVAEFAEWYSKNNIGMSGYYKIAWEICKVAQGARGTFVRECKSGDPNAAYQNSHIQKCGMLEADPVLGNSDYGKAQAKTNKLDINNKAKLIADMTGCTLEVAMEMLPKTETQS